MILFGVLSVLLSGFGSLMGALPSVAFAWVSPLLGVLVTGVSGLVGFAAGGPMAPFIAGEMVLLSLLLAARLVIGLLRLLHVFG